MFIKVCDPVRNLFYLVGKKYLTLKDFFLKALLILHKILKFYKYFLVCWIAWHARCVQTTPG